MEDSKKSKTKRIVVNNLRHPTLGRRTGKNVVGDKHIRKDHEGRECFADYFSDESEISALDSVSDASLSFINVVRRPRRCKSIRLPATVVPDDSIREPRPMSPFSPNESKRKSRSFDNSNCLSNSQTLIKPIPKYGNVLPPSPVSSASLKNDDKLSSTNTTVCRTHDNHGPVHDLEHTPEVAMLSHDSPTKAYQLASNTKSAGLATKDKTVKTSRQRSTKHLSASRTPSKLHHGGLLNGSITISKESSSEVGEETDRIRCQLSPLLMEKNVANNVLTADDGLSKQDVGPSLAEEAVADFDWRTKYQFNLEKFSTKTENTSNQVAEAGVPAKRCNNTMILDDCTYPKRSKVKSSVANHTVAIISKSKPIGQQEISNLKRNKSNLSAKNKSTKKSSHDENKSKCLQQNESAPAIVANHSPVNPKESTSSVSNMLIETQSNCTSSFNSTGELISSTSLYKRTESENVLAVDLQTSAVMPESISSSLEKEMESEDVLAAVGLCTSVVMSRADRNDSTKHRDKSVLRGATRDETSVEALRESRPNYKLINNGNSREGTETDKRKFNSSNSHTTACVLLSRDATLDKTNKNLSCAPENEGNCVGIFSSSNMLNEANDSALSEYQVSSFNKESSEIVANNISFKSNKTSNCKNVRERCDVGKIKNTSQNLVFGNNAEEEIPSEKAESNASVDSNSSRVNLPLSPNKSNSKTCQLQNMGAVGLRTSMVMSKADRNDSTKQKKAKSVLKGATCDETSVEALPESRPNDELINNGKGRDGTVTDKRKFNSSNSHTSACVLLDKDAVLDKTNENLSSTPENEGNCVGIFSASNMLNEANDSALSEHQVSSFSKETNETVTNNMPLKSNRTSSSKNVRERRDVGKIKSTSRNVVRGNNAEEEILSEQADSNTNVNSNISRVNPNKPNSKTCQLRGPVCKLTAFDSSHDHTVETVDSKDLSADKSRPTATKKKTKTNDSKAKQNENIFKDVNLVNHVLISPSCGVGSIDPENESVRHKRKKKELSNQQHSRNKSSSNCDFEVNDVMKLDDCVATPKKKLKVSRKNNSKSRDLGKLVSKISFDENYDCKRDKEQASSARITKRKTPEFQNQSVGSTQRGSLRDRSNRSSGLNICEKPVCAVLEVVKTATKRKKDKCKNPGRDNNLSTCPQAENWANCKIPNFPNCSERRPLSINGYCESMTCYSDSPNVSGYVSQDAVNNTTLKNKKPSTADSRPRKTAKLGTPVASSSKTRNSDVLKSLMKSHKKRQLTNFHKIYVPCIDENICVRRSIRQRVPPLEYWRNQRLKYKRQSLCYVIDGVIDPSLSDSQLQPKKKNVKQRPTKECRVVKLPPDMVEVPTQQIPVYNPEISDEVYVDCIGLQNAKCYYDADGREEGECNPFVICKSLQQKSFSAGEIILRPGACKRLQSVMADTLVFKVDEGQLLVRIHETSFISVPGDFFFVPSGNLYSLKNTTKVEAKLTFFQLKGPTA